MSRIDELIEELCPDGVEYRPLNQILMYEQPTKYLVKSASYDDKFDVPVLTAGQTFILGYTNETDGVYEASQEQPVIIFDDFTTAFQWVDFPFKAKSSAMKILSAPKCMRNEIRYVYYAMQCIGFEPGSHSRHWISKYGNFRIPYPPLEVQREIVRVLDLFTSLEAELEAELEARRLQYEHYRDQVFNELYDRVEVRSIGEVGSFSRGNGPQKKDLLDSGIHPVIHYGQIYTRYGLIAEDTYSYVDQSVFDRAKRASPGDLIIADTSENDEDLAKAVAWLGSVDIAVSNHTYVFRHDMNPRFVSLFFSSRSFQKQKARFVFGTKVRSISISNIGKITMPIPSLNEQALISSKLLAMHQLCESISDGLPAEIAARRQQYEYYRDKLLTFKEKVG